MTDHVAPPVLDQRDLTLELDDNEERFESGANWFFWIAGLSLVNSLLVLCGVNWAFVVGLGITQVIDTIAAQYVAALSEDAAAKAGQTVKILIIGFDVSVALAVVLVGWLARQKHRWAFALGIFLYAGDGLLFLLAFDIMSIAFHILALIFMIRGLIALFRVNRLERLIAAQAPPIKLDAERPFEMPRVKHKSQ